MIRVIVAEGTHLVRGAFVTLLDLESDLVVVGEVGNGDEILATALRSRPDVAIIDIDLPGTDGLSAAAELRAGVPECKVIVLADLGHPIVLRRALGDQIDGLLLKDARPGELVDAVRRASAGKRVIARRFAMTAWSGSDDPLTAREVDVLRLTADGEDVPVVAEVLHLSVGTVRNYLTSVVNKLNARNRIDAIRIARASGII